MPRRDRSRSPDSPYKKVRQSAHSRSPSPTRRYHQRSRHDDDRDRDRERDRDRDRDRRGHDRRDRDRDRDHDRRDRDKDRHRRDDRRRSRSAERERPRENGAVATPPSKTATPPVEDEKMRAKRERLEAWKRDRGKKSLGDAKAKAMALAGKQGSSAGKQIYSCLIPT
jgi:ATP-dependent RNA helicase DDX46/PRP5